MNKDITVTVHAGSFEFQARLLNDGWVRVFLEGALAGTAFGDGTHLVERFCDPVGFGLRRARLGVGDRAHAQRLHPARLVGLTCVHRLACLDPDSTPLPPLRAVRPRGDGHTSAPSGVLVTAHARM